MEFDGILDIATGTSRRSKIWKNRKIKWSELVGKLFEENKTSETYKEFISMRKTDQSDIKDVGGYVGGYLRQGRRSPKNVSHRQLITLDLDFANIDFWSDFQLLFEHAAVIHSTHKHHPKNPRFRLLMPLSREVSSDEYVAISRRVAGDLGIDLFDNTTFEVNRLMYWPSSPSDVDYYFNTQEGPWLDPDEVLARYVDWKDSSAWPTSDAYLEDIHTKAQKQEDPTTKKGIIGVFCRTYTLTDAIETFLSKDYVETLEGRYTYLKGSAAAGLVVYADKFGFSHHGTDPASGKLCNAFDLVRLHKYGHLDETPTSKKSFKAMHQFALEDREVKRTLASENLSQAKFDFADIDVEDVELVESDLDWMEDLEVDSKGDYKSTATNINTILNNDRRLKGVFRTNQFDTKRYVFANLPWRQISGPEAIRNVDYSGIRNYLETIYGIHSVQKIKDALALQFEKMSFHPIKEFLSSLDWDGSERVDSLLINYFGAVDNEYSKEAIRKTLVGAITRVFNPGCKFDLVLTLVGREGTGKSTFVSKLGGQWYSDSFMTVHGKEAFEQLQGAWLMEMAELSGLRRAEVEQVKHYLTKQVDTYRPAFGETVESYPRQCVFIGTTNNQDFLKSSTGNRRFIPIDVRPEEVLLSVFDDLTEYEVSQIWAEAFQMFKKGEPLFMSGQAAVTAKEQQELHTEIDERLGLIKDYLEMLLPEDWSEKTLEQRVHYLNTPDELNAKGVRRRDKVCIAEIWCECLGLSRDKMTIYNVRPINEMMKKLKDWKYRPTASVFPVYGYQRHFVRKNQV